MKRLMLGVWTDSERRGQASTGRIVGLAFHEGIIVKAYTSVVIDRVLGYSLAI